MISINKLTVSGRQLAFLVGAATLSAVVLVRLLPPGLARQIPAFLFLWVVPGLAWMAVISGAPVERFVLGTGLAFSGNVTIGLLLSYLPGPVRPGSLIVASLFVVFAPWLWKRGFSFRGIESKKKWSFKEFVLAALLLLAICLRLANLGYKEIQGDEGVILVRAAESITGAEENIFLHQKGPAEVIVPLASWSLTGEIDDVWVRMPFVWASVISVLALFALGRAWKGPIVALSVAFLMAINGFSIAFGRIVQYQSLVLCWGVLALLAATRYRRNGKAADLIMAALFSSSSLLAHYDGLLFTVVVAWEILRRGGWTLPRNRRVLAFAMLLGAGHLALFYIPFALSPNFAQTVRYLFSDRLGASESSGLISWSGPEVWRMLTLYNSTWYLLLVILLALLGVAVLVRQKSIGTTRIFLLAAIPILFYLFIVADPRTHVYTFFPGTVILAGVGFSGIWYRLRSRPWFAQALFGAASLAGMAILALHPFLLFVDVSMERQRNWSEKRPAGFLFWTTWEEPPIYGLFGFPHQAGWRVVPGLLNEDDLPYASNEEEEITNWYLAQARRTHCNDFRTLIVAENAQDALPIDPDWYEQLHPTASISVANRQGLTLFSRSTDPVLEKVDALGSRRWLAPAQIVQPDYGGSNRVDTLLDNDVRLLGYDLDVTMSMPGGRVIVTLYWEALQAIDRNFQVFVHMTGDGQFAQHDGAPECAINPTTRWEPNEIIVDPHIVDLPMDFQPGNVQLVVGMYDLLTEDRKTIAGNPDNIIYLRDVTVRER